MPDPRFPLDLQPGTRIRLIHMDTSELDPAAPEPPIPGTVGVVIGGDLDQVWVRWEGHPQSVCLIPSLDQYEVLPPLPVSPEWVSALAGFLPGPQKK